ncbi:MAG: DNA-3-methyladenine glycosylase [Methylotenera sp.]|nr:DNA-3-methyladenine glycosylase [Methylotenera sp.]MDO9233899.1 DNA-3-methyladenine glycosylase [Methylotenera sp.]MDO9387947.1 DNA-3-methyladenine glycosylase [Methylotenera sp.]MDP2102741.1 DNA-3-methyladenine glycosylase [Methylotenera sp.]MDP2282381.1 DNA-3-methyladenine glycosylase [Methylotenera sp.]
MSTQYQPISQFLSELDYDWAQLIATVGECKFQTKPEREPYEALVRAVAYQQLSTKAGDAILGKFIKNFGAFPSPEQLIAAEFDTLRATGFSGRKIETLKVIAAGAMSGLVPSREIADNMSNEALIERLVRLKGIGQWTVEMMLIFTLARMDILPADDFGIADGYRRLKKLDAPPKCKQMAEIGKAWSPYRTIASWYLWRVPKELGPI